MPARRVQLSRIGMLAGSIALVVGLTACSVDDNDAAALRTATVTRGDVTAGVTANGSFAAVTSENLGFATGGKLTSVKVKVGQHVKAGQLLAKIDSRVARQALEQAKANLAAQEAGLGRISSAPTVSGAQNSVDQARKVVAAQKGQAVATARADQRAIDRAKVQQNTDEDALDAARSAVSVLKSQCSQATSAAEASKANAALVQTALKELQSDDPAVVAQAQQTLQQLNSQLTTPTTTSSETACASVATAKAAVTAAKQKVVADRTAVVAAQQKKKVDAAAGRLAVENAQQAVVAAQNGLNTSAADRPHSLDQQQALVDAAQAAVDTAQKAVDDTELVAPADGTITVVNGSKGEYVAASTGTTALAPGSKAAIPGSSTAASQTGATRPGGTQFIVLSDIDKVQLILPFEQSDAARLKPGQPVSVQPDALPGTELAGKVIAVSPSSTVTTGAVSYLATIGLDEVNSKLKDGQTARATVITRQQANVLTVPNAAVHQQGTTSTVVLVNDDGTQQTVPFEAGVAGNETTEVKSGLTEGQHVVLPDGAN
ncbi:MAG: biotin/lipoyl-binding protein [Microlunatus sp.]